MALDSVKNDLDSTAQSLIRFRDSIKAALGNLKKTFNVRDIATLAVAGIVGAGSAQAQEAPKVVGAGEEHTRVLQKGETPKQTVILPGGSATTTKGGLTVTASVSRGENSATVPRKSDGSIDFEKWFAGKSEKERDELVLTLTSRSDKIQYLKFEKSIGNNLDATIIGGVQEIEGKRAAIITQNDELGKLTAINNALKIIEEMAGKIEKGVSLNKEERERLTLALNTPGVNPGVVAGIRRHANL